MELQPVKPELEKLFRATIEVAAPTHASNTPLGRRLFIPITGGRFEGEKLSGTVLPGGADWQLVHADGTAVLQARYALCTADNALIYVQNRGFRWGPVTVLEQLARGETVDPSNYYFRTSPEFETGAIKYTWLNHIIAVCSGVRLINTVILDFYAVR
jgi:hypothetical protein